LIAKLYYLMVTRSNVSFECGKAVLFSTKDESLKCNSTDTHVVEKGSIIVFRLWT